MSPIKRRLNAISRVCGKWTIVLVLLGAWFAVIGTLKARDDWKSAIDLRKAFAPFHPEVADFYRARMREDIGDAILGVIVGTTAAVVARRRWVRAMRVAEGMCERCGYDLRATPDCCPECGMRVPQHTGPPA